MPLTSRRVDLVPFQYIYTLDNGNAAPLVSVDVLPRTGVVANRKVERVNDSDGGEFERDRADERFDDLFALTGSLDDE